MADPRHVLRHLDLKHLRQLIEVAERGSIRAAADALAITQPALSRSIRAMEQEVGAPLVERGSLGTVLTAFGETLVKYARIIDANLRLAERELRGMTTSSDTVEPIAFGMSWLAEAVIAPRLIESVLQRNPRVRLTLTVGDYESLAAKLASGRLEFFVGPPPLKNPTVGVSTELLTEFPAVVLVRPEHPLAALARVDVKELASQQWILPATGTLPRITYDNFFLKHGTAPPEPMFEVQPLSPIIRGLIRDWDLVTILPRVVVERDIEEGLLTELPFDDEIVFPMHVTRRQMGHQSPNCERLLEEIRQICARDAPSAYPRR